MIIDIECGNNIGFQNQNGFTYFYTSNDWELVRHRHKFEASSKSYYEIKLNNNGNTSYSYNHIASVCNDESFFLNKENYINTYYYIGDGSFYVNASLQPKTTNVIEASTRMFKAGDVVMIAYDNSTGGFWAGWNGFWYNGLSNIDCCILYTASSNSLFDAAFKYRNSFITTALTYNTNDGLYNRSFYLDGSTSNFQVSSTSIIYTSNFCLEFWFKPEDNTRTQRIVRTLSEYFNIWIGVDGILYLKFGNGSPLCSSLPVTFNSWHHLAVERTGSTLDLYIDGVKSATSHTLTSESFQYGIFFESTSVADRFKGHISDVVKHTNLYGANFTPSDYTLRQKTPGIDLAADYTNNLLQNSKHNIAIATYYSKDSAKFNDITNNEYNPPTGFSELQPTADLTFTTKSDVKTYFQTSTQIFVYNTPPTISTSKYDDGYRYLLESCGWYITGVQSQLTISGTVKFEDIPYVSLVELYDSDTRLKIQAKYSDAAGNYIFSKVNPREHFIISHDVTKTYNSLIRSNILPW